MDSIAGLPAPSSTNLIGAKDPGGLLQPMQIDSSGQIIADLPQYRGQRLPGQSLSVVLADSHPQIEVIGTVYVRPPGREVAHFVLSNTFSAGSPLAVNAWTQIVASANTEIVNLQYYNTTNDFVYVALGPAGFETDKFLIWPNTVSEVVPWYCPQGQRISLRAGGLADITTGRVGLNLWG